MYIPFTRGRQIFHWILTILVIAWLIYSPNMLGPAPIVAKAESLSLHITIAVLVLFTMGVLIRLRRSKDSFVKPPDEISDSERDWINLSYVLMFGLITLVAISGLALGVIYDPSVTIFFVIPFHFGAMPAASSFLSSVHSILVLLLKLGVAVHVIWVLKLQIRDRAPVLKRMFDI